MFVFINGPLGIGKSTVAFELHQRFSNSIFLDGDYISRVHPFELGDPSRFEYIGKTIAHLIPFHKENGYDNFVFNYVFTDEDVLARFMAHIEELDIPIQRFLLTCKDETLLERVKKRSREGKVDSELERCLVLNQEFQEKTELKSLGTPISTDGVSASEVASRIYDKVNEHWISTKGN